MNNFMSACVVILSTHPVRVGVRGSEYLAYDRDSGSELYPEVPENKNKCLSK